jgi:hypothetical protein
MSQFTNAQNDLVQKIVSGQWGRSRVDSELKKLETEYPGESFGTYVPKRKEKPWDMTYLKELEKLFYHGADSKAFIEYIAEVGDEVYRAKRMKKALLSGLLVVAIIAVIVILVKKLMGD